MTQTIYFISDPHLGHKGILKFGQRKHDTMDEMHIAMGDAWNAKVRKDKDIIWILGDVCMDIETLPWLHTLRGEKRLILGNHDTFNYDVYRQYFAKVMHFHKAYHGIVMTHIPVHPNELEYRNWKWNVHGHIHHSEKNILGDKYLNVNMDIVGYAPLALDEIREKLK